MLASTIQFSNTNQTTNPHRPPIQENHNTANLNSLNQDRSRSTFSTRTNTHACCLRTQQYAKHTTNPEPASTLSTPPKRQYSHEHRSPDGNSASSSTNSMSSPPREHTPRSADPPTQHLRMLRVLVLLRKEVIQPHLPV